MSDITVIDGVPKAILGEALKRAASDLITDAKKRMRSAVNSLNSYSENPGNQMGAFPNPDLLEERLGEAGRAVAEYRAQYEIGQRVWGQGCEMIADAKEEETQS